MEVEKRVEGRGGYASEEAMFLHFHRALGWTHPEVARAAKAKAAEEARLKAEEEAAEAVAEREAEEPAVEEEVEVEVEEVKSEEA